MVNGSHVHGGTRKSSGSHTSYRCSHGKRFTPTKKPRPTTLNSPGWIPRVLSHHSLWRVAFVYPAENSSDKLPLNATAVKWNVGAEGVLSGSHLAIKPEAVLVQMDVFHRTPAWLPLVRQQPESVRIRRIQPTRHLLWIPSRSVPVR